MHKLPLILWYAGSVIQNYTMLRGRFLMKFKNTAIILTGVLALTAVAPLAASAAPSTNIESTSEQSPSKAQGSLDDWVFN
jgi:hypothetical protein